MLQVVTFKCQKVAGRVTFHWLCYTKDIQRYEFLSAKNKDCY
jgi:hypothetical protein